MRRRSHVARLSKDQKEALALAGELREKLAAIFGEEGEEEPEKERPARRGRRSKAREEEPEKKPRRREATGPSLDDVRAKATEVIEEFGNEELEAILEDFGVKRVSDLDEADYAKVVEECEKSLADDGKGDD